MFALQSRPRTVGLKKSAKVSGATRSFDRSQRLVVNAKYGENNSYIDLDDMDSTVGSWTMYGDDDPKRYPVLQEEFFERAASPFYSRKVQLFFCLAVGTGLACAYFFKAQFDLNLPITQGGANMTFERGMYPKDACPPGLPPVSPLCFTDK